MFYGRRRTCSIAIEHALRPIECVPRLIYSVLWATERVLWAKEHVLWAIERGLWWMRRYLYPSNYPKTLKVSATLQSVFLSAQPETADNYRLTFMQSACVARSANITDDSHTLTIPTLKVNAALQAVLLGMEGACNFNSLLGMASKEKNVFLLSHLLSLRCCYAFYL